MSSSHAKAAPSEALIRLTAARKRYGRRAVLNIEHLEVFDGDRIELVGSNSSGKSTLTRMLTGYGKLSAGALQRRSDFQPAKIGFLPQSGGLYRDLTLMDNLIVIARLFGRQGLINPHSERILADLDLFEYLDRKAAKLSGGIQRLGALAALVSAQPQGLILDEPFAGLDAEKSDAVKAVLANTAYRFRFIIVTTHEPLGLFPDGREIFIQNGSLVSPDEKAENVS